MDTLTPSLSELWPKSPYCYVAIAFGLSALVRLTITALRCYEFVDNPKWSCSKVFTFFWRQMVGRSATSPRSDVPTSPDYFAAFVVGWLEFMIYPFLFVAGAYTFVGAWVGLKTIALHQSWATDRTLFNHYLIGNALVLVLSFVCLRDDLQWFPAV
jgi:hypothetical protein